MFLTATVQIALVELHVRDRLETPVALDEDAA